MKKCDVLITYCWNRVGYNILKSLTQQGISVWVADTSAKNICSLSRYVSGSFVYPDPFTQEEEFIQCLLDKIQELKPKMLLPTHDESVIIAKYRDSFPKELVIPIDKYEQLVRLSDKEIATQLAKEAGVPIPIVYGNKDEVKVFPMVCKTKVGNSAKGVFFPKNRQALELLISKYGEKQVFLEEKCGGVDHSVDCIRYGKFFYASVYRALITKTDGGGTTTQRIIVDCPRLIEYAQLLLDYVDYKGVCGLDFRYDESTGMVAFIEVNARYTGGLATPIYAGFDIPWIHYCLAMKGTFDKPINVRIGTKTKWILGDIITLVGRFISFKWHWSEFRQLMSFRFDGFDDFDKTDKRAIWGEMSYYFRKLVKNRKLNL